MVLFTVLIDVYFTFTKGAKKSFAPEDNWTDEKALWISCVIAFGCSLFSGIVGIPFLKRKLIKKRQDDLAMSQNLKNCGDLVQVTDGTKVAETHVSNEAFSDPESLKSAKDQGVVIFGSAFGANDDNFDKSGVSGVSGLDMDKSGISAVSSLSAFKKQLMRGVEYDVHHVEDDPLVAAIHANAEKWDPDTEFVFGFLQVVSAICVIFAHGAGEVGYMAGPLAVIYNITMDPAKNVVTLSAKTTPEIWVVLIGAFGLVVGLATYGYKVCAAVGTQLAKITPSRGYAAELATSFVIMIAAQYGLPTSSSQCITGGIIGIAVFEGSKGVNYKLLSLTAMSWVWTMFVMGLGTSLIFSQGIYAPNRYVDLAYSKSLGTSYVTTCNEFNYCSKTQYLNGCGLVSVEPRMFSMGTCTNCTTYARATCKSNQYLKSCGGLSSGTCTNCTAKDVTACPAGSWLSGCPGSCIS